MSNFIVTIRELTGAKREHIYEIETQPGEALALGRAVRLEYGERARFRTNPAWPMGHHGTIVERTPMPGVIDSQSVLVDHVRIDVEAA